MDVLEKVRDSAPDSPERDRALKWFLALHRIFLRHGSHNISKEDRFKMWEDGNFQALITCFEKDLDVARKPSSKVNNSDASKVQRARHAAADGNKKKAANFLKASNKGIAATGENADPRVIAQLDAKHPPRTNRMPGYITHPDGTPLDDEDAFVEL